MFKQWGYGKAMSEAVANAIYDILVQDCGAYDGGHERESFVAHQTTEDVIEWRFGGKLGFGGKFWRNAGRIYVNCYREDETPEMRKMIDKANERLAAL